MGVYKMSHCHECAQYTFLFLHNRLEPPCSLRRGIDLAQRFQAALSHFWRKYCRLFLALFWLSGFLCGMWAFLSRESVVSGLIGEAAAGSLSIVGLVLVTFFPFILSAFAVSLSWPVWILPISFCKAFLFSFVSFGIWRFYGSAGWLIHLLLMFSDLVAVPVLYGFWLRHISGEQSIRRWELIGALALCILLGSIEYCILSPLLGRLIA